MLRRVFSSTARSVVVLDYSELVSARQLFAKVEEAYSPEGLGILFVKNIPQWEERRARLLPLARRLALLPSEELTKLELPEVGYAVGWSHGKEKFMGEPDVSKGSFYANPETNHPLSREGSFHSNVWPTHALPELEPAFKDLGATMIKAGSLLARHIDMFVAHKLRSYTEGTLFNIITKEFSNIGRLLHYFPKQGGKAADTWCGWHNDHGALTGLTSSLYLHEATGAEVPSSQASTPGSGLFIMSRSGEVVKAAIPPSCAAFQIGETAQILSNGWLHATPHAVKSAEDTNGVSRNTFAVFMQPSAKYPFSATVDAEKIAKTPTEVPSLKDRFTPGSTFGDFHNATIKAYSVTN